MSTFAPVIGAQPADRAPQRIDAEQALSRLRSMAARHGKADPELDPAALDVARRFEALLLHNMLKAMRSTTMAENTSSANSLYEDMFDQRIAELISADRGIGLAARIAERIAAPAKSAPGATLNAGELARLRSLVHENPPPTRGATQVERPAADLSAVSRRGGPAAGAAQAMDFRWPRRLFASDPTLPEGHRTVHRVKRAFISELRHLAEHSARQIGSSALPVLAVAALESGWGRHVAADASGRSSHNLFGIKSTNSSEPAIVARTGEYTDGRFRAVQARFRRYPDKAAAMDDFAAFLKRNPRYRTALAHAGDAERFVRELHAAGYATDPRYADKLIDVMRQIQALAPDLPRAPIS